MITEGSQHEIIFAIADLTVIIFGWLPLAPKQLYFRINGEFI